MKIPVDVNDAHNALAGVVAFYAQALKTQQATIEGLTQQLQQLQARMTTVAETGEKMKQPSEPELDDLSEIRRRAAKCVHADTACTLVRWINRANIQAIWR